MAILTNPQAILSRDDATYSEVDVPEWGGSIRIKSLSGAERTQILKAMNRNKETVDGVFEKLIVLGAVDENGKKLFTDDAATLAILQSKDAGVTRRIGEAVLKLSGIAAGSAESAEKN